MLSDDYGWKEKNSSSEVDLCVTYSESIDSNHVERDCCHCDQKCDAYNYEGQTKLCVN